MSYVHAIEAYTPKTPQEEADQRLILEYISRFPENILLRENQMAHITSSGFVVNKNAGRVLLAHHNIRGVWAWTGGHADGDADLPAVALREAAEETGAAPLRLLSDAIASLDILPVYGHTKNGRYVPAHLHLSVAYLLLGNEAAPLRPRAGENTAVSWFDASFIAPENFSEEDVLLYGKLLSRARALLA
ncbi:NUDIX hydrolase [Ruminococcaceae bacterium OttesenSCG-928-O06]|nr:NUDIX hydrolase [Ruminococcaceae bacterium OttesenSCG-928-O06]